MKVSEYETRVPGSCAVLTSCKSLTEIIYNFS